MKTMFNAWVAEKLASFLDGQGFTLEVKVPDTAGNTSKTLVRDAFGNRYEIQVKHLGRINTDDFNRLALRSEYSIF